MATKKEIAEGIKVQFTNVKKRGRILGQALKARAEIAATHRRLRSAFADLGEEIYGRMATGQAKILSADAELATYKTRIEGGKAELGQREKALTEILEARKEKATVEEKPEKAPAPKSPPKA